MPEAEYQHISKTIPDNPVFVVSGSATTLAKSQIDKLTHSDDFEPYVVELTLDKIYNQDMDEMINRLINQLIKNKLGLVYFSTSERAMQENLEYAKSHDINPDDIPGVLVKNHGPFSWGTDCFNAVHNAVVLEEVANMNFNTLLINPDVARINQNLLNKHYLRKHGANAYYGQKK